MLFLRSIFTLPYHTPVCESTWPHSPCLCVHSAKLKHVSPEIEHNVYNTVMLSNTGFLAFISRSIEQPPEAHFKRYKKEILLPAGRTGPLNDMSQMLWYLHDPKTQHLVSCLRSKLHGMFQLWAPPSWNSELWCCWKYGCSKTGRF